MLSQGSLNSVAYCHNFVRRDLDLIQVLSIVIHSTGDVANPVKVQRPSHIVKFVEINWTGTT